MMARIFPHVSTSIATWIPCSPMQVSHIHSRIGTTQSSQCPDPSDPVYEPEVKSFENLWRKSIEAYVKVHGPDATITFVPEWGYVVPARNIARDHSDFWSQTVPVSSA